jgi:hypothetical protein
VKAEVCEALNIMTESLCDKYLGLPAMVGADRSDCFRHLIDRVNLRINGWKEKLLSFGGKEILIKSVAQAVPVYAMMVFKIPKKFAKESQQPFRNTGGVMTMTIKGFIGRSGGRFVCRKGKEVWDLEIYNPLIWLC